MTTVSLAAAKALRALGMGQNGPALANPIEVTPGMAWCKHDASGEWVLVAGYERGGVWWPWGGARGYAEWALAVHPTDALEWLEQEDIARWSKRGEYEPPWCGSVVRNVSLLDRKELRAESAAALLDSVLAALAAT